MGARMDWLFKFGFVLALAFFIALLANLTRLSHNPFQQHQIAGEVLTWDNDQKRGWVTSNGNFILLQRTGDIAGQLPRAGCQIEAFGEYSSIQDRKSLIFDATLIVLKSCPLTDISPDNSNQAFVR